MTCICPIPLFIEQTVEEKFISNSSQERKWGMAEDVQYFQQN